MISLTLLLTSCPSVPPVKPVEVDITFPVFPDPAGIVRLNESCQVVMPLSYWLLIVEYKIEVDTAETLYRALK
jgi:hypothetical protein